MAIDNTIDNQGIKKGLGLVVSQLIQSNQKLDTQETGNLFKELRHNNRLTEKLLSEKLKDDEMKERTLDMSPEIVADVIISNREMKLDKKLHGDNRADFSFLNTIAVTLFDTFKANMVYQGESLNIMYLSNKRALANSIALSKSAEDTKITFKDLGKKFIEAAMESRERQKGLLNAIKKKLDKPLQATVEGLRKDTRKQLKFNEKQSKDEKKSMFSGLMNLKQNLGEKLTNLGKTLMTPFSLINKGLKKLTSMFPKFFGGIGFALKTIGAILLIGGLYKFLSSETWQKMKPNIAESIGNGLEMMDYAVQTLYGIITDYVIPMFMWLVNGLVSALDTLGLVRKDQRTYDAEDYDKKTAQMESNVTRMSEEGYDEQGTFEPDYMYKTRMKGKKLAIERLAKRKENKDENLQATHTNRKEAYVKRYMTFYSGSTRAEALAEYREDYEGHIGFIGLSNIGMPDYLDSTGSSGGGGNSTIVTDASTNVGGNSYMVDGHAVTDVSYIASINNQIP